MLVNILRRSSKKETEKNTDKKVSVQGILAKGSRKQNADTKRDDYEGRRKKDENNTSKIKAYRENH